MIDSMLIFIGCLWLLYKFYRKKESYILFLSVMLFLFQLSKWPFFFDQKVGLSLAGFFFSGVQFYYFYQSKKKNFIIFGLVFLLFGIAFASDLYLQKITEAL